MSTSSDTTESARLAVKRKRHTILGSLRLRLLVLVVLAFIPLVVLAVFNMAYQKRQAVVQAESEALRLAHLASSAQEHLIDDARGLLLALAQLPCVRNLDGGSCSTILSSLWQQGEPYADLGAADLNGDVFASTLPQTEAVNVAGTIAFQNVIRTSGFAIGGYLVSPISDKPVLSVGHPILGPSGQLAGVIFAGIDVAWLNELATEQDLPSGSTVSIIDEDGVVLARYPEPERWGGTRVSPSILEPILAQQEGVAETEGIDGVTRIHAFTSTWGSATGAVYVRVGLPEELAFAEVNRLSQRSLLALGIALTMALALTWLVSGTVFMRPVRALTHATERLNAGDLSARMGPSNAPGELGELARTFDRMAESLQVREADNKRMLDSLYEERQRRADLLRGLIAAQEGERKRIARELHDETSQGLSALMLSLGTAELALSSSDQDASSHLRSAVSIADSMLKDIHRLIEDLRPSLLDDLGLVPAMAWYAEQRLKPLGIAVGLHSSLGHTRLPLTYETALFRIAQEAITNVARHSAATRVKIELGTLDGEVVLRFEDNGRGFQMVSQAEGPDDVTRKGLGLLGIRERATVLGGTFELDAAPGQGTALEVRLPMMGDIEHA